MSAIMKLRQARNVEQIAEELEPLAVSLATLADQAQASIRSVEEASIQQAREWSIQQERAAIEVSMAAKALEKHVKALQQAADTLWQTTSEAKHSQRVQFRTLATVAGVAATLAAGLVTGLWLWLAPAPEVHNQLDTKGVAEFLKPAILEALKHR